MFVSRKNDKNMETQELRDKVLMISNIIMMKPLFCTMMYLLFFISNNAFGINHREDPQQILIDTLLTIEESKIMSKENSINVIIETQDSHFMDLFFNRFILFGWYSYNSEKGKKHNHLIDLGIFRCNEIKKTFPLLGYSYHISNEFVFNSQKFSIGPTIGGSIYILGFSLGSDIVYYTDFHDKALYWKPRIGVMYLGFASLFVAGYIPLYNKYSYINNFSIGVTIPIWLMGKEKKR